MEPREVWQLTEGHTAIVLDPEKIVYFISLFPSSGSHVLASKHVPVSTDQRLTLGAVSAPFKVAGTFGQEYGMC